MMVNQKTNSHLISSGDSFEFSFPVESNDHFEAHVSSITPHVEKSVEMTKKSKKKDSVMCLGKLVTRIAPYESELAKLTQINDTSNRSETSTNSTSQMTPNCGIGNNIIFSNSATDVSNEFEDWPFSFVPSNNLDNLKGNKDEKSTNVCYHQPPHSAIEPRHREKFFMMRDEQLQADKALSSQDTSHYINERTGDSSQKTLNIPHLPPLSSSCPVSYIPYSTIDNNTRFRYARCSPAATRWYYDDNRQGPPSNISKGLRNLIHKQKKPGLHKNSSVLTEDSNVFDNHKSVNKVSRNPYICRSTSLDGMARPSFNKQIKLETFENNMEFIGKSDDFDDRTNSLPIESRIMSTDPNFYGFTTESSHHTDAKSFNETVTTFLQNIGKSVEKIPCVHRKYLSFWALFHAVMELGGSDIVTKNRKWKKVAGLLKLPSSLTSASFTLRTNYQYYLSDFERYYLGLADIETIRSENKKTSAGSHFQQAPSTEYDKYYEFTQQQQHMHYQPQLETASTDSTGYFSSLHPVTHNQLHFVNVMPSNESNDALNLYPTTPTVNFDSPNVSTQPHLQPFYEPLLDLSSKDMEDFFDMTISY